MGKTDETCRNIDGPYLHKHYRGDIVYGGKEKSVNRNACTSGALEAQSLKRLMDVPTGYLLQRKGYYILDRQQQNKAALYLRISRDDGGDAESNSIGNQRSILMRYAAEHGFSITAEYVDDGISGTIFDRPSFKRMISDVEAGKIGIIMCKDLSRLGRNNAMVSYYTELFFPDNDIRFIAVNDDIDSAKGDNEIMPFKSVINEYYARDISKKIRSSYRAQALKGAFTGMIAPYGYMKSPEDKHVLIPNPETSMIVCRIFNMAAGGHSSYAVAKALTNEKIMIPSVYNKQKHGVGCVRVYTADTDWSPSTIQGIIKNEVYLGHMVSQKQTSKSYKNKKIIRLPKEDRIRVLNTHEPLIEQEIFDMANKCIAVKRKINKLGFVNIFVGFIKCADCKSGLSYTYPSKSSTCFGYQCNKYRHHFRRYCTSHYIKYNNLYAIVLGAIQERVKSLENHEDYLTLYAKKLFEQSADDGIKYLRTELDKNKMRYDELDLLIRRLFEQNAAGVLTNERFIAISSVYEKEQEEIKSKITESQEKLSAHESSGENMLRFFEIVRKYTDIKELNVNLLNDLIDTIVIHEPETEKQRKKRKQKVEINFRFI